MIQKWLHFDDFAEENIKHITENPNWLQIPDHPYRIITIRSSGSGKANSLFNLINQQANTVKTYLYAKDPYKAK